MKTQSVLLGIAAALLTPSLAATTTSSSSSSSTTTLSNNPSSEPVIGQVTDQGCFNSSLGLSQVSENLSFNSDGKCGQLCYDKDYPVGGTTGGQECWCGDEYPPESALVDDDECNIGCTGFDTTACGGLDTWSIYNTGLKLAVHYHDPETTSTVSSSSSSPSKTSAGGTSESSSAPTESSSDSDSSGTSSKTVGIAVGAVGGVLIIGGAIGGVLWYLRKKRNQEIEEEHRRNAAVNAFINGSNPPDSSHGSISMTDSRLDPIINHRRLSDGSIADNQDYSRKILRVTNA